MYIVDYELPKKSNSILRVSGIGSQIERGEHDFFQFEERTLLCLSELGTTVLLVLFIFRYLTIKSSTYIIKHVIRRNLAASF